MANERQTAVPAYLGDYQNGVARKIDTGGGLEQEGISATQAAVGPITDLAFGPDGSRYLAAISRERIYRATPNGLIYTAWTKAWVKQSRLAAEH